MKIDLPLLQATRKVRKKRRPEIVRKKQQEASWLSLR